MLELTGLNSPVSLSLRPRYNVMVDFVADHECPVSGQTGQEMF